jgi:2-polyprenyl-3-methyl-5-hydroxy-6-metoxy-1,4-benzoquinol methylase
MSISNEKTAPVHSPLSELPPKKICDLPKAYLLKQLESHYQAKPPPQIVETDYELWQCAETGLQFASPMLPGTAAFYEWVSSFDIYYPGLRWEYRKVRQILESEGLFDRKSRVLDAGSGKGDFLRTLDFLPAQNKFALDLNEPAIRTCRELGYNAFCGTVEKAMTAGFLKSGEFPVVTSFHCLEHVSQPVEFMQALLKVVGPGGRVYASTPYSPMSNESERFDVLNLPPHHLTRWNLKAYQRLATTLGVKMRYFTPPGGAAKRALRAFWNSQHAPNQSISKVTLLMDLTRHFPSYLRWYRKHRKRERNHHGIGADVILVEFTVA